MKKRVTAFLMTTAMCLSIPMTALADAGNQSQEISVTLTAEPTYVVTIPASVTMGNEGTTVDMTASEVKNLPEEKKISVTIAGTDAYRNQMLLSADTTPATSLRYQIITSDGETIETTGGSNQANGKEIAAFTGDETKQYTVKPVIAGRYEYGVAYTGTITFGISLVERG